MTDLFHFWVNFPFNERENEFLKSAVSESVVLNVIYVRDVMT